MYNEQVNCSRYRKVGSQTGENPSSPTFFEPLHHRQVKKREDMKTQQVKLVFEKNGTNWGMVKDTIEHNIELPIPEGFDVGVHLIGAKVKDRIDEKEGLDAASKCTGWVPQVAEVITDRDIEKLVGKVLTIVDATMMDKDQRKAFKSLIKQSIYSHYNMIRERSYQIAQEPPVLIGSLED